MRRKKIIFGSLFVLFLILMMPSNLGIQQKMVKEGFKKDLTEKLESINLNDLDDVKHPKLYGLVYLIYAHREIRLSRIVDIAVEFGFGYFEVVHPILLLWAYWLGITSAMWLSFWIFISDNFGWGWFEDY